MQRTKSSVRRAREFKQFDQVNLLDVDAGDGFDLLQQATKNEGVKEKEPKETSVLSDSSITNSPSPVLSFKKPASSTTRTARAATTTTPADPKPDRTFTKSVTSTHTSARRTATTTPTFQRTATERVTSKTKHTDPTVGKKISELKDELLKAKQALSDAQSTFQEKEGKWNAEREGLVSGMRSGGREVERITAELTASQGEAKELRASVEALKTEKETSLQKIQELQAALLASASREHELASAKAVLEEQVTSLTASKQTLAEREQTAVARVQSLVGVHQELARRTELERVLHMAEKRSFDASVAKLTAEVEKMTLCLQKEQSTTQSARRSLEAIEAVNKRLEAEKVRLETTVQSQEQTIERTLSTPMASPPTALSAFKPQVTSETEELWQVINDMEAAKKDIVDKHSSELDKCTAENEEMWAECERLASEVERLKLELVEAAAAVTAANEREKEWKAEVERMQGKEREGSGGSAYGFKEPAPAKSPSLMGEATRFGFVPPQVQQTQSQTRLARSVSDRRRDLQQARMARKQSEVGSAISKQQTTTFDSIMDEMGAKKKNSVTSPMSPRKS